VCCSPDFNGTCDDGLEILRAVLAAGVREPLTENGYSSALPGVWYLRAKDTARRVSASHALAILQLLSASSVDVLPRGPADTDSILGLAALADAPELVRWLVTAAGAPLEERDDNGDTPLLKSCWEHAWAAAHALLDCGARADVQSTDAQTMWPVLLALRGSTFDETLFRRLLKEDRTSLLRFSALSGVGPLHAAAIVENKALSILLDSGLPHMEEAINAVMCISSADDSGTQLTPLRCALRNRHWSAALILLAAGARVDIAGHVDSKVETAVAWARTSVGCKHRGVKRAIAARAKAHVAQAARRGVAGKPPSETSASHAASAAAVAPSTKLGALRAAAAAAVVGASPVAGGSGHAGTGVAVEAPSYRADPAVKRAKVPHRCQRSAKNGCELAAEAAAGIAATPGPSTIAVATFTALAGAAAAGSTGRREALTSAHAAPTLSEHSSLSFMAAALCVLQPPPHLGAALNLAEEPACSDVTCGPSGAAFAAGVDALSVTATVGGSAAEPAAKFGSCSQVAPATAPASAERSATAHAVGHGFSDSTAAPLLAALRSGETSAALPDGPERACARLIRRNVAPEAGHLGCGWSRFDAAR
jgi:hypothetical protein